MGNVRKEAMRRIMVAALMLFAGTLAAAAPDWPTAPVKIVVPFAAGATPDIVARFIAERLHDKLARTFIVESRPGASGNTGPEAVARAAPDGATIGVSIGGPLTINALLFGKLHVPCPSSPQAMTALLRNDVQMVCLWAIAVMPQHGAGALKVLAVSTDERSALLPDIPTLREAGPDVEADAWSGLIAPARISPATAERIGQLVGEAISADDVRGELATQFMAPIPGTRVDDDIARWAPVIASAKIKVGKVKSEWLMPFALPSCFAGSCCVTGRI
jgi:tripartite-type tricarboxylate transporter receptor subunit TctC